MRLRPFKRYERRQPWSSLLVSCISWSSHPDISCRSREWKNRFFIFSEIFRFDSLTYFQLTVAYFSCCHLRMQKLNQKLEIFAWLLIKQFSKWKNYWGFISFRMTGLSILWHLKWLKIILYNNKETKSINKVSIYKLKWEIVFEARVFTGCHEDKTHILFGLW